VDNPSETISRLGGVVSTALLMAVLFALVLGVYGAVTIDAFRPAHMQHTAAPPPAAVTPPTAPTAVIISPSPQLNQVNPAASHSLLAAIQPAYWVEYGAYRGSFYAEKLVQRLGVVGIKAEIKQVQGAGGVLYFSVRSNATSDRVTADANVKLAAQLGIAPLVHRGDGRALAQPVVARTTTPAATAQNAHYWVQFGAYNAPLYAAALRDQLRRAGVDAAIIERHQPGYARYLVRTPPSLGRDEARGLAARGQSILGVQPLVGRTSAPAA